ncbi:hypothetical protein KFL_009830020 [Klebsormidium nitens]|uniref:Uncharacterized protein n=1 Tax=Klebsormidium nitens TaxID=105231 RepID=A0A1Y1IU39_KLENI|nr:hypothetical protein KFL_009830020 [Klebsormidium nitens]|eukprot:GAQ92336.1 hypothetical protein KFL_009830020 [Klebsormidium nitens]
MRLIDGNATTSAGLTTRAAKKKAFPNDHILIVKGSTPDKFLNDFIRDVQKPLLAAGFERRTINERVQNWRPFTKRGQPKRTWGACFGSRADADAAWTEYLPLKKPLLGMGIIIERCKPGSKAAPNGPRDSAAELVDMR